MQFRHAVKVLCNRVLSFRILEDAEKGVQSKRVHLELHFSAQKVASCTHVGALRQDFESILPASLSHLFLHVYE